MNDIGRVSILGAILCAGANAWAMEPPVLVSPGQFDKSLARIEARCPTFNWTSVVGAEYYELAVHVGDGKGEAAPVLEQVIPGAANGWTPALGQCLERGRDYTWTVRAVGANFTTGWAEGSPFLVDTGLSAVEAEAIVQALAARNPKILGSDFQVNGQGDVTASTYSGDGSALTGVNAANVTCVGCVGSTDLAANAVESSTIVDGTIVGADLAAEAVGSTEILDGSITSSDIGANQIFSANIANNQIGTTKIANGSVLNEDLADNSIGTAKILDGSILNADLANEQIDSAKILDGSILRQDIADSQIGTLQIADSAVQSVDIKNGTITGDDVADGSITGADIASASIPGIDLTSNALLLSAPIASNFDSAGSPNFVPNDVTIGSESRRFCFLTRVLVRDQFADNSGGECSVFTSNGAWILRAAAADGNGSSSGGDVDVRCVARCISW